jgi:hypothetical protein
VEYFGCGNYYKRLNGLSCAFIVTKLDDMTEKVIPLYANYSLLGSKKQDYLDFKRVAELMNDKGSFNPSPHSGSPPHTCVGWIASLVGGEGLDQIQAIKSGMNRGR